MLWARMKKPKIGDVSYSYSRSRYVYTKPGFWSFGDEEELSPGARVLTREELRKSLAENMVDIRGMNAAMDELFRDSNA